MTGLREAVQAGEPVAGSWVAVGHPAVAEVSASLGFEFVVLDLEHAPTGLERLEDCIRAVEAAPGETAPVVRVPDNDAVAVKRVLDAGAAGVIAPMVESAAGARDLVDAARYPPAGSRGVAAARASDYGLRFADYYEHADDGILTVAQVETQPGLDAVEEIAAVDGVDALLVGPADLSANLGVFGEYDGETFSAAVERVLDAAHEQGVPVATLATSHAEIDDWVARGFDFLVVGTDLGYLADGARAARQRYHARVEER